MTPAASNAACSSGTVAVFALTFAKALVLEAALEAAAGLAAGDGAATPPADGDAAGAELTGDDAAAGAVDCVGLEAAAVGELVAD